MQMWQAVRYSDMWNLIFHNFKGLLKLLSMLTLDISVMWQSKGNLSRLLSGNFSRALCTSFVVWVANRPSLSGIVLFWYKRLWPILNRYFLYYSTWKVQQKFSSSGCVIMNLFIYASVFSVFYSCNQSGQRGEVLCMSSDNGSSLFSSEHRVYLYTPPWYVSQSMIPSKAWQNTDRPLSITLRCGEMSSGSVCSRWRGFMGSDGTQQPACP